MRGGAGGDGWGVKIIKIPPMGMKGGAEDNVTRAPPGCLFSASPLCIAPQQHWWPFETLHILHYPFIRAASNYRETPCPALKPPPPPPPSATDGDSLFCILSGEMSGVICDQSDPQLVAAAHIAARQLLFSASEEKEVGVP